MNREKSENSVGIISDEKCCRTEFLSAENNENIKRAAEIIKNGGLVAFPTETVYGLGANALDPEAARKIYAAKGRPSDNPLIIHIAEPEDAEKYAYTSELYYKIAERFMPGPITVILPKRPCIPDTVTGGLNTVAIRVPADFYASKLISYAGVPIAAPSANISGRPSATLARHCLADFDGRIDAILDGGECTFGLESTIVKPTSDGKLRLLRPGAVTPDDLRCICNDIEIDPAVLNKFSGTPEAPGMKYRHYAPSAPVIILDGADEQVYKFLSDKSDCGILCYSEDMPRVSGKKVLSMGSRYSPAEQAHMLFACLRNFDEVPVIYARMPSKNGIGLAVFNRLIKAAGYEIISI